MLDNITCSFCILDEQLRHELYVLFLTTSDRNISSIHDAFQDLLVDGYGKSFYKKYNPAARTSLPKSLEQKKYIK